MVTSVGFASVIRDNKNTKYSKDCCCRNLSRGWLLANYLSVGNQSLAQKELSTMPYAIESSSGSLLRDDDAKRRGGRRGPLAILSKSVD